MKKKTNAGWRKLAVKEAKRIVKERDKGTCQKCGRMDGVLHGSHVYPEGKYPDLSAEPDNLKQLCYQCHFHWWHKHPLAASEWFKKTFPERYKKLKRLSQRITKRDWKKEYERLKSL